MKLLTNEVYGQSCHYWYQADLMTDHEYGQIFNTSHDQIKEILQVIQADKLKGDYKEGIFWYFGPDQNQMDLMIRYLEKKVDIQMNVKDFDFALHLDNLNEFKDSLEKSILG